MAKAAWRDEAERLYLLGYTLERIREALPEPVSLATLSKWSQEGDWPARRKAALANRRSVAELLREDLEAKVQALKAQESLDAGAYDAIVKITAAIERLERGAYDLKTAAVGVMGVFTQWLREQQPPAAELAVVRSWLAAWFRSLE